MIEKVFHLSKKSGYRPQAEDTSLEADVLEFSLLRSRTPIERYTMAIALIKQTRQLSLQSLKQRFPQLTGKAFARKISQAWLQEHCPVDFVPGSNEKMWIQDPLEIAFLLHDLFESIQVDYFITGGSAAILYGEPRTTRDLSVAISIQPDRLDETIALLENSGFYVAGIEDVKTGRINVLQVIHTDTIARADLILVGTTPFEIMQLERRPGNIDRREKNLILCDPGRCGVKQATMATTKPVRKTMARCFGNPQGSVRVARSRLFARLGNPSRYHLRITSGVCRDRK